MANREPQSQFEVMLMNEPHSSFLIDVFHTREELNLSLEQMELAKVHLADKVRSNIDFHRRFSRENHWVSHFVGEELMLFLTTQKHPDTDENKAADQQNHPCHLRIYLLGSAGAEVLELFKSLNLEASLSNTVQSLGRYQMKYLIPKAS